MDVREGLLRYQWKARGKDCHKRREGMERRIGIWWEKAEGGQRFVEEKVSASIESSKEVQG